MNPREETRVLAQLEDKDIREIKDNVEVEIHGREWLTQRPESAPVCKDATEQVIRSVNQAAYQRGYEDGKIANDGE